MVLPSSELAQALLLICQILVPCLSRHEPHTGPELLPGAGSCPGDAYPGEPWWDHARCGDDRHCRQLCEGAAR